MSTAWEAQSDLRRALAEAHRHHQAGQLADAERLYRTILRVDCGHPNATHLLGVLAHQVGQHDIALVLIQRAIALHPVVSLYHGNLGNVLKALGRAADAVTAYRRALCLQGDYPEVQYNLGTVLDEAGDGAGAITAYRRAVSYRPDFAEAYYNLGSALEEHGSPDTATAAYRHAVSARPDYAEAHHALGCALLLDARFDAGWPEYAWLWTVDAIARRARVFDVPVWEGSDPDGRIILLHADQGLGDALQYCRYVPLLAARGAVVVLEVPPTLVRLLSGFSDVALVVGHQQDVLPIDLHCPLSRLPLLFGAREETIPADVPYLTVPANLADAWEKRLAPAEWRIGLAWQGNPAYAKDRRRSLSPELLAPLFAVGEELRLHVYSLQKEGPPAPTGAQLIDLMERAADFADTAALIANLDLVITVDTAVAHLAGALGKPVWLLNRCDSCWRWMKTRPDSPWYPTMRIYRQACPGDWEGVIGDVVTALRRHVGLEPVPARA